MKHFNRVCWEWAVKPGSHMPPMYMRHGRRYCMGYCSDMRTEVAGNITHPSLYPRHACEVDSSSTSQACRQCMFSFVREVSQEVPAATSQIHRRHIRTKLNACDTSPTCEDITPPATRNIVGLYSRHACEVELESQACRRWRLTWPLLPTTSVLISERCRRQHRQLCRG